MMRAQTLRTIVILAFFLAVFLPSVSAALNSTSLQRSYKFDETYAAAVNPNTWKDNQSIANATSVGVNGLLDTAGGKDGNYLNGWGQDAGDWMSAKYMDALLPMTISLHFASNSDSYCTGTNTCQILGLTSRNSNASYIIRINSSLGSKLQVNASGLGCGASTSNILQNIYPSQNVSDGNFHNLVIRFNATGNNASIYVDGLYVNSTNFNVSNGTCGGMNNTEVTIGKKNGTEIASNSFTAIAAGDGIDEFYMWNCTLNPQGILDLNSSTKTNSIFPFSTSTGICEPAPYMGPLYWVIGAIDFQNATNLLVWNATIDNVTVYNQTVGGTITTSILKSDSVLHNITFQANNYFTRTYLSQNASTDFTAELYQAIINLYAYNVVSGQAINIFNSSITSHVFYAVAGNTTMQVAAGTITRANVSSMNYLTYNLNFSVDPLTTTTISVNLSPSITIHVYNESNGNLFNSNTTSLTLRVFCPSTTEEYTLTTNTTQVNITCPWNKMRLYVTYGNTTYFRTLMPSLTSTDVNWYVIDLTSKTGVQKVFYLNDLAGQYNQGSKKVEKIIGTQQVTINQEQWDIENKIVTYFILYDSYIMSLIDNVASTRALGYFVADTQATHTITVPTLPFSPQQTIDDFQWRYLFDKPGNSTPGNLFMQYSSSTGTLYNVTWLIVNASNKSQVFINMSFFTINGSMNFTPLVNGTQYVSYLTFNHSSFSTHTDQHLWNELQKLLDDVLAGMHNPATFKKWTSFILITTFVLIFSGITTAAAAIVGMVLTAFFYGIGWLTISGGLFAILIIIALLVILTGEGIR